MRAMKRLGSLLLAAMMILGLATSVLASGNTYTKYEGPYKITIDTSENPSANIYEAYQIFAGDLAKDATGNLILSNIKWGEGVKEEDTTLMTDIRGISVGEKKPFKDCENAADVAKALGEYTDKDNAVAQAFADVIGQHLGTIAGNAAQGPDNKSVFIEVDEPGYYLVQNATPASGGPENFSYTRYILDVVGDVNVKPKTDVPEVEKKVDDVNDSTDTEDAEKWQDSADYDIGDEIPFQLTGTLPSIETLNDYETYSITFNDTMTNLTYVDKSIVVKVNGEEVTTKFDVDWNEDKKTLTISCEDVKTLGVALKGGDKIVVEYKATLDASAAIGAEGNPNEVYLTYSNNPNSGGKGDTGTTPKDKVTVFTFKLDVDKVDGKGASLEGAGFTLNKWNGTAWEKVGEEIKGVTTFEFKGLDDGYYKLEETTVPAGYNKADDVLFAVVAEHDADSAEPALTSLVVKALTQSEDNKFEEGAVISGDDGTFSAEVKTGLLGTDVVNNAGTQLPETGGMGTTIFYVVGAILILGAGILLVTNKRMSK